MARILSLVIFFAFAAQAQITSRWSILQSYTFAGKPVFGVRNRIIFITDCETTSACITGGGSTVWLFRDSGTAWAQAHPLGGGGGGTGILELNGLTADPQTFTSPDDTNVVLTIASAGSNHAFTMSWAGALAKARQHAATAYIDAGNTWSTGVQDFGAATSLKVPTSNGAAPTANGLVAYDSTANKYKFGANTATKIIATEDGNVATSTAHAANGANCGAGEFPLGVNASGASETCTSLPTTISGTVNQIAASAATGAIILSIPTNPTLPGTTSGTFSGNLTGDVTGNAGTATALAANPADCSTNQPAIGVAATGAANCIALTATVVKSASGVLSAAAVGTDYGTPDASTKILTNTTVDAEATGNVLTIPVKFYFAAAGCQNTTASLFWDTPTTNPAVAACVTGTNTQKGVADFADGANSLSMQTNFLLPSDWAGTVDVTFFWFTTATSGSVVWQMATSCVADGETGDPAWNTASTVTDVAKGTTNQYNVATITGLTMTGCTASELLNLKPLRDPTHGSDSLAATARLIGIELTLRRAI